MPPWGPPVEESGMEWESFFAKRDYFLELGWRMLQPQEGANTSWVCPNCGLMVHYDWLYRHHSGHTGKSAVDFEAS